MSVSLLEDAADGEEIPLSDLSGSRVQQPKRLGGDQSRIQEAEDEEAT